MYLKTWRRHLCLCIFGRGIPRLWLSRFSPRPWLPRSNWLSLLESDPVLSGHHFPFLSFFFSLSALSRSISSFHSHLSVHLFHVCVRLFCSSLSHMPFSSESLLQFPHMENHGRSSLGTNDLDDFIMSVVDDHRRIDADGETDRPVIRCLCVAW